MNPSESIPGKRLATALSAFPPRTTCLSPHHSHRPTSGQTSVWGGGEDQNSHFFLVFTSKYLYKQADSSSAATWQYRRAFEPTSTWGDLLSQAKVVLCCLTDNSINNLIVILCRPQMSILCSLWTKALRKNRTTSWTPQKWTMKSRWKRAMFKERRGRGRASAGPSVTSAGKNLKIQSPH